MNQAEIIEIVIGALPYPDQIKKIDLGRSGGIEFNWRGTQFFVSETLHVSEVEDGMLCGSNIAILFSKLLKQAQIAGDWK